MFSSSSRLIFTQLNKRRAEEGWGQTRYLRSLSSNSYQSPDIGHLQISWQKFTFIKLLLTTKRWGWQWSDQVVVWATQAGDADDSGRRVILTPSWRGLCPSDRVSWGVLESEYIPHNTAELKARGRYDKTTFSSFSISYFKKISQACLGMTHACWGVPSPGLGECPSWLDF